MSLLNETINRYKKLSMPLKASIWFFICTFLQKGISVITTPIFTRLLTTEEYGLFSVYLSWSDLLSIVITFGLSSVVYQKRLVQIDSEDGRNRLTSSLQGLSTLTAIISFGIYWFVRRWVNPIFGLSTEMVVSIYISVLMQTGFSFWAMHERVSFLYRRLVIVTIAVSVLKPLLGIVSVVLFPTQKVYARIFSLVLVEILAFFPIYIKQALSGKKFFDTAHWKYAMLFVLPLIPHYLSQRVLSQSNRVLISNIVGLDAAGIYSLSYSVGWLIQIVTTALDYTLSPWTFQKLKERNIEKLKSFSVVPLLLMGIICLIYIAFIPEVIRIFASEEYYDAVWMAPPLVLSTYFILLYTMFVYVEYYYEKTKYVMLVTMSSAVINIALNYLLINWFGYFAAAYGTMICYLIYVICHYLVFKKICIQEFGTIVYDIKKIWLISFAVVILSFLTMFLYDWLFIRVLCVVGIMCVVFIKRKSLLEFMNSLIKEK